MKILNMRTYNSESKTLAFFSIETADGIEIKSLTIVDGTKGLFVGLPSEKGKDGTYYGRIFIPSDLKEEITKLALTEYEKISGSNIPFDDNKDLPF